MNKLIRSLLLFSMLNFGLAFTETFSIQQTDTLFFDDFENGSGNWTITNDGGDCVWEVYPPNQYCSIGSVFVANSFDCSSDLFTTATISQSFDFSNYDSLYIDFDSDWKTQIATNYAVIEGSSDGGLTWFPLAEYFGAFDIRCFHELIDISILSGQSNCKFRIRTIQAYFSGWWMIDNFTIFGNIDNPNEVTQDNNHPDKFELSQNYPNPFNPTTKIKYQIPIESFVSLNVFDVLGNEIATLINEEKPAGDYEVEFDVGTSRDLSLSSGIYFYQLKAGSFVQTKKMILLK